MKLKLPEISPALSITLAIVVFVAATAIAQTWYLQRNLNMAVKTLMTPAEVHPALVLASPTPEVATPSATPKSKVNGSATVANSPAPVKE